MKRAMDGAVSRLLADGTNNTQPRVHHDRGILAGANATGLTGALFEQSSANAAAGGHDEMSDREHALQELGAGVITSKIHNLQT